MTAFVHRMIPGPRVEVHEGESGYHDVFGCPVFSSIFASDLVPEGLLYEPDAALLQVDGREVLFVSLPVPLFRTSTRLPSRPLQVDDPLAEEVITMSLGYALQRGHQHFGRVEERCYDGVYRVVVTVPGWRRG